MTALEQSIRSYFGIMNPDDLATIKELFAPETIAASDCISRQGVACRQMSFIGSGLMRVYAHNGEKEVTQWISTPGYFVTDLSSFMFDTPARWTIEALSDCELFSISKSDYKTIGKRVSGWHELEKLFIAKCFTMLEDRIYSHLSMSAEERYQHFFSQQPELFNQVPLQYIASMLGMTPETFSRVRRKIVRG
ncbi:MAG: Crp/Fnr family transcriptional regulator [Cryomorphaceae bacterium]